MNKKILAGAMAVALTAPMVAMATNGYFAIGYGSISRGMAGVGTAIAHDTLAASTNPAAMGMVGNRADLGAELFSPSDRSGTTAFGATSRTQTSDRDAFLIPSFGYNVVIDKTTTFGVSVYGNGGMNTQYNPQGGANLYGFNDKLGVDLSQLVIAPTLTRKLNNDHTVGVSLLLGYQKFKAQGLQNFCSLKASGCGSGAGSVVGNSGLTNQGYDTSTGAGLRIGWLGKVSPKVTLGAAYSTKMYMSEFDKYDELFAEQGDFDIPANATVGIAVQATSKLTVAADVQHIWYSDVKAIANAGPAITGGAISGSRGQLGTNNGLGFGWDDMTIFKVGAEYMHNNKLTLRGGLSYGDQPIGEGEIAFNVIAPAVMETHMTLGFTYKPEKNQAWTVAYMHAFENDVTGDWPVAFGGTSGSNQSNIEMEQNAIEASYSWKF